MKKVLKIIAAFCGIVALLLVICAVNHQIQRKREEPLFSPLGQTVMIDGRQMSVYVEGEGEHTLVFLSGGGTCSPILDFKALYSQLTDTCQIAVVEKFGYGFSDVTDKSRDIDTVLEHTRAALTAAGLKAPYVLCPHSMSGIEALYWAQKYPDEVSAIVGLDMSTPAAYEKLNISGPLLRLLQFAASAGITRLIPGLSDSYAIQSGALSEHEEAVYRAIFYRRTMTADMVNETLCVKNSAKLVSQGEIPSIPFLLFCSDGSGGTGFSKEDWRAIQSEFAAECADAQLVELDCGHYVHDFEYERIAAEIKDFLNR
ncbi:MAG: alpha/beta hydrolase [Oscillospiraceae bacterium]|nr:alpha/beta hydrolase [Oscillospiraceae bacterium]MDE7172004.1 alpha/beta hydrolase [Oscillospiraceae bacterium]